jgi:hypothetical protein
MAEDAVGIVGQHPVNVHGGVPAMGQQELERVFASWQRIRIGFARGRAALSLTASSMAASFVEHARKTAGQ